MRILVVEDDSLVASGIKQGLTNAGYTVDVARNAASAEPRRTVVFRFMPEA